ncbi:hypothetical protein [uncultured Roseovarius sp.]|uniref:DUF1127 domain-containing protein n=1 Tax=uncultured Roseovarius sp. TaxID=293344 RepID=UPI0025E6F8B1|nr:hypothetical protein [uncultured Roseovarius sp.]
MAYLHHTQADCNTTAPRPRLGLRHYLALWQQRRNLARMEEWQRRDLGLSDREIEAEASRAPWDAPEAWRQ